MTHMNLPPINHSNSKVPHPINEYHSIAATDELLDKVYAMRYQSYSADGYIKENADKLFFDEFDALSNNTSYLTFYNDKAIGSIRASIFHPESPLPIPAMEIFGDEIEKHCGFNHSFVECNKFVIAPEFQRRGGVAARFFVFKNMVDMAEQINAKYILAAVRLEHIDFYRSYHFRAISCSKNYNHLSFKTTLMLCDDIPIVSDFFKMTQKRLMKNAQRR